MTELDESQLSDKVCKLLGTLRMYKEGMLFKRQRGLHSNQKKLKFQERYCRLTSHSLDYFDTNPRRRDTPKGQFAVEQIRIVESMHPDMFGKDYQHLFPFQVGDSSEIMYFCTKSGAEREEWLLAFRKASRDKYTRMLSHYHKGIFGLHLKGRWGCCGSPQRAAPGCSPIPDRQPPPLTPQVHRALSIVHEDAPNNSSKRRADTIGDFTLGGSIGGDGEGSVFNFVPVADGIDRATGSESPQEPRVRSFTFVVPVRPKPDPKKNGSKRNTLDIDYLDNDKKENESLKDMDEVKKKPQAWGSDLSSDLSVKVDENKRASSPSPSEDSGKGTSTAGSSRPSSQVIDDGVRPVRSWSIGKCNILSPLTDQVAPAPSSEPEDNRRHKTSCSTDETDGGQTDNFTDTKTHSEEVKEREGREIEEGGDTVGKGLEDTLKASDQPKRNQRNMSSPPEISSEEQEETDSFDTTSLSSEVQLRNRLPFSQSMDAIKRESFQLPPSPLVAMMKSDYQTTPTTTPTHTSSSKRLSTTSGSSQPKSRQSVMMQAVMDRPDATLRRKRTIEEYSPLHRACRDGNVAALWDMLNGSILADLEEPTFGAASYTPLFLAFLNDHYQTVECLLEHGADTSATEPINRAPVLHLACERGCSDMVDLLLSYNADVNQIDCRGNTALWQACRNGHLNIVEKLLNKGALVNTEGENRCTPLHEAASSGHASIVEVLIVQGGADPCPRDNHDATPYDLAYSEGHEEVMQVLQRLLPEDIRPYSLLHSHTPLRHQMVTSLVFTDTDTLVSGSRDCHATFWEVNDNEMNIKQRVRQQDSVLGVERWARNLVVSSTFITVNSLEDPTQRRIVADDSREDESLTNPPLHFASFGADGVLATASVESNLVKVWPPMTPQAGLDVQPQARLEIGVTKETPQPGIIHSLSVSRSVDHPWIAVGLQPGSLFQPQGNKTVHLYNWQEGRVHQIFDAGTGGLSVTVHTTFSPCGQQLAVGCHENLCIWEPDTGDLLYKFTTTKKLSVTGLSYSPNGAHLAVGLASGETQVFDIESNCCIFTLETHNEYPAAACALAYSENGQLLAVGHRNGQIQIWKTYTGQLLVDS